MSDIETDARLEKLELEMNALHVKADSILEILAKADATISKVAEEIMPTVNELMNSKMLKMLMPGKK